MPSDETSSTRLLDYSNKMLKKVPKFDEIDKQNINVLLLDSNELQKLENIDSFGQLEKVFFFSLKMSIHNPKLLSFPSFISFI